MKSANEIRENLSKIELERKDILDKTAEEMVNQITEDFFSSCEKRYVISKENFPNMSIVSERVVKTLIQLGYRVDYCDITDEWVVAV